MNPRDETDYQRLFLAIFLAASLLIFWQYKVEWPRRQALAKLAAQVHDQRSQDAISRTEAVSGKDLESDENATLTHEQRLAAAPRVAIKTDTLSGSLSLKGARLDDLMLVKYRTAVDSTSPSFTLLAPSGDADSYFVQAGWVSGDEKTKVPDQNTLWQADGKQLTAGSTVNLRWKNDEGVVFKLAISLDNNYMFRVQQQVDNGSSRAISVIPYAYVNRSYLLPEQAPFLHEGPIGVAAGTLSETTYKELKDKGNKTYEDANGWFGISDHYWLTALIPDEAKTKVTMSHYMKHGRDRFQVDYLGETLSVEPAKSASSGLRLFAGAKELKILDRYAAGNADKHEAPIPLLDRSLDFGSFYFLAKPMCMVVNSLFHATGNFGVAILIFIIFVKLAMFPLASKSYKSMAAMRELQPEMVKIRERYADDQIGMHKATRDLYKREKVNPAAGCLPVLMQLIVFLALFRGLNVTIELRHAPFYGWIKDLSAPDPSNLFTGFGMIPWDPPGWLHLGLLPIAYCITMIIQTAQQPKPADPVQAKMMSYMPYFMLIFFDKMAAGFVLYWTWSNILSILQQHLITRRHKPKGGSEPDSTSGAVAGASS